MCPLQGGGRTALMVGRIGVKARRHFGCSEIGRDAVERLADVDGDDEAGGG